MFSNRDTEILYYLKDKNSPVTIAELAKTFNVSERSIRYYIDAINLMLDKPLINLKKGSYYVNNYDLLNQTLLNHQPHYFSASLKKQIMLYTIIFKRTINLSAISEELEISRTSAKTYLESIKPVLNEYELSLELEPRKGLSLKGNETLIRKLMMQTALDYYNDNKHEQVLDKIIQEYINETDQHQVKSCILKIQNALNITFSDYYYRFIKLHITIMFHEVKRGNTLTATTSDGFLSSCIEFKFIEKIMNQTDIDFPMSEILNLTDIIIGSHYSNVSQSSEHNWFEYDLLVNKVIHLFSEYYHLNLNHDKQLYQSLLIHLKPTMYRLLNNIKMQDIDVQMIINRFPKEFEVMKKVLHKLNFFTNIEEDSDEIALLTIHFKTAINRVNASKTQKKKLLIVCSHGYGTSKLLEQQLIDLYHVSIFDCIPLHSLETYNRLNELDYIITTVGSLKSCSNIPIIHVNPILSHEDFSVIDEILTMRRKNRIYLSQILSAVEKCSENVNVSLLEEKMDDLFGDMLIHDLTPSLGVLKFLPKENIMRLKTLNSWEEAVMLSSQILVNHHYVEESYAKSMIESFHNYGSYMIIDEGIAIPHARNDGNVLKTGMSLLILDEPVSFINGKEIKMFFSFCSKDNMEHLDALVTIANLIRESDFKQQVYTLKSIDDIMNYISDFVHKIN